MVGLVTKKWSLRAWMEERKSVSSNHSHKQKELTFINKKIKLLGALLSVSPCPRVNIKFLFVEWVIPLTSSDITCDRVTYFYTLLYPAHIRGKVKQNSNTVNDLVLIHTQVTFLAVHVECFGCFGYLYRNVIGAKCVEQCLEKFAAM